MQFLLVIVSTLLLGGCLGMPDSVEPVDDFELNKYLGKWYEIARLDHSFEEGLERVSAEYTRSPEGGLLVKNRGFDSSSEQWTQAEGKAFFVNQDDQGYLQVSFFGPFYSSYVVFELDKQDYQYAFVSGASHDYLWLLSRTPNVSKELKHEFVRQAKAKGFDTQSLIFVEHGD